jgi:hypothetical protein
MSVDYAGNTTRVGDIFKSAGEAFTCLGQLTHSLAAQEENESCATRQQQQQGVSGTGAKWTDEEIEMLHRYVYKS